MKSLVDFIIQLDVENLKTCLKENDSSVADFEDCRGKSIGSRFSPDSFLGLMDRTNPTKCKLIFEIVERIASNLHFTQSMGEFLASEGAVESSKIVVSEALKRGPDLGQFLRGDRSLRLHRYTRICRQNLIMTQPFLEFGK